MTAPSAQPWVNLRIFAWRDAEGWVLSIGGMGEASCGIHAMTRLGPGESPDNPQDLIPALEATLAPIKAQDFASCDVRYPASSGTHVWPLR